jgi:hypothetical protein
MWLPEELDPQAPENQRAVEVQLLVHCSTSEVVGSLAMRRSGIEETSREFVEKGAAVCAKV